MVAGSILPVSIRDDGEVVYLFGEENPLEDSARGWSDFGGGCEDCSDRDTVAGRKRKVLDTAAREGVEETTGFLGTPGGILARLKRANRGPGRTRARSGKSRRKRGSAGTKRRNADAYGQYESLTHGTYTVFFLPLPYDPRLPEYYNSNHQLLWSKLDKKYLNESKLFEKRAVRWFTREDMRRRRGEFRGFYREIVDRILAEKDGDPVFRAFVARGVAG